MSTYVEVTYITFRILLWVCALLSVVFPFLYHRQTRGTWSFTPIGRHIMSFRALFALMLVFTVLSVFVPVWVTTTAGVVLFTLAVGVLIEQIRFVLVPQTMDPDDVLVEDYTHAGHASRLLYREDTEVKSRPVVITMSILAALQFLFGGLVTLNLPDESYNATVLTVGAFGTLLVAAAQTGVQFYVQNLVTPQVDVAAYRDSSGQIVSGPAAPPAEVPVDVVNEDTRRLH
jgi:hypothetical protein